MVAGRGVVGGGGITRGGRVRGMVVLEERGALGSGEGAETDIDRHKDRQNRSKLIKRFRCTVYIIYIITKQNTILSQWYLLPISVH